MSTITWTNPAGGDWSVRADWSSSPNLPSPGDEVAITLPGTYTVTQSGTVTVAGLVLADPSGTLDTNGDLNAGTLTLDAGVLDLNGTLANTTVLDNGGTVQVIPHITDEIQHRIQLLAERSKSDVVITEIGGTTGDIEGLPFLEAIREFALDLGVDDLGFEHPGGRLFMSYLTNKESLAAQATSAALTTLGLGGLP